jgi:hypothetical protein
MAELRFRVGAIFPADNPTARWVMAVSIVLGDIRTAAAHAAREGAADHERLYFGRLLDLHVREGLWLAVVEHRDRDDVRRFVAILPDEARAARDRLEAIVADESGPYADLAGSGGETFRCSRTIGEVGHLREALDELAEVESGYRLEGDEKRAGYADLVVGRLGPGDAAGPVVEPLTVFMEHVEAAWLRPWRG